MHLSIAGCRSGQKELQYMWGKEMLVARNCSDGGNSVSVWLPKGNWYYFWDDKKYAGDKTESISAATGVVPAFVKEGAIIPMAPFAKSTFFIPKDNLLVHAYTGADGSSFQLGGSTGRDAAASADGSAGNSGGASGSGASGGLGGKGGSGGTRPATMRRWPAAARAAIPAGRVETGAAARAAAATPGLVDRLRSPAVVNSPVALAVSASLAGRPESCR